MHPQHVRRLDGAGSAIRRLTAGGLVAILGLALAGCGDAATPSITSSVASPTAAPRGTTVASIAPSPSGSAAAVAPERITVHQAGVVVEPPSGLAQATARSFATGIAASEPTVAVLPDGSFVYQGWDRPPNGAEGT